MFKETIMKRLRDWFCAGGTLSARHRSTHRVRPALEALEDRRTPSVFGAVSSVSDNAGNSETYDVHTDGTLWGNVNGSQFVQVRGVSNVHSVSAGLDNSSLANVFVVHNDGSLELLNAQTIVNNTTPNSTPQQGQHLANGVYRVTAEGNGKALVIDNNNFLWQYDPNGPSPGMPFNSDGSPEFPGQPSTPLGPNFTLLDAHVTQATPLKEQLAFGGVQTVVALHSDGTLTSDTQQASSNSTPYNVLKVTIGQGIWSISSAPANDQYLYTLSSNGHVQKNELLDWTTPTLTVDADYLSANQGILDVNVGWNGTDWVAISGGGQVYRDGQLVSGSSGALSAYAGPGGTFYDVAQNGDLVQWSPQAHEVWVWVYKPPAFNWHGGWVKVPFSTNWTTVDSHVSAN
jgi:hypothetical protein